MRLRLNDFPLVHHVDDVGVHGGRKAVGNDGGRAPLVDEGRKTLEPPVFGP